MPRRILVKGGSGAGKTTLASALARRLGVPHVELDALHHGPNWTEAPAAELRRSVEDAIDDERGWVVDGNYESKLGSLVLDRAELIVWLDLPLGLKLRRLVWRTGRHWILQEELWNGNREHLRQVLLHVDSLIPWAIWSHFMYRRKWPGLLRDRAFVRLRTSREVESWLDDFCAEV